MPPDHVIWQVIGESPSSLALLTLTWEYFLQREQCDEEPLVLVIWCYRAPSLALHAHDANIYCLRVEITGLSFNHRRHIGAGG